jgi:drug/metabolite transporter (DMT)-like permease
VGGHLASLADASVFLVLFWRFALAAMLLSPFVWLAVRRVPRVGRPGWARGLARQAGIGVLAMGGYIAAVVWAIDLGVPAGTTALITALQPLLTAALAGPLLGERLGAWGWAGLGIGFAGVGMAVQGSLGTAAAWAYALPFGAVLCVVTASIAARNDANDRLSLPVIIGAQSAATAVVLLIPAALAGPVAPPMEALFWGAVAWFIVLSTIGAYGLYWLCLRRMGATRTASLMYLTPPVTALWAWAMFGEAITAGIVVGFVVCLGGVALAARDGGRLRHAAQ